MKKSTTTTILLSLALALSLTLGLPSQSLAQFSTPTESVQSMLDEVLAILRAPDFDLARDKQDIDAVVSAAFDSNTIAQSVLASSYRELDAQQGAEFEELFFSILKATYIERLDAYTDESIEVTGEEVDGNRGTVMSLIYASNSNIAVNYSLRQRPNGWFVYDIIVEDVSLLKSYRATYRSIIRRSGIDGLLNGIRTQATGLE